MKWLPDPSEPSCSGQLGVTPSACATPGRSRSSAIASSRRVVSSFSRSMLSAAISPRERALRELEAIRAERLFDRPTVAPFYERISGVLRG